MKKTSSDALTSNESCPRSHPLWLSEKQVSALVGISVSKLQKDRHHCIGMPYSRVGSKTIRYSLTDVEHYMAENLITPLQ